MRRPRNPARAARREAELRERLGAERPTCIYCGHAEPVALRRVPRRHLLKHHVLGRNHDPDLTVFVCLNCNALVHDEMLRDAEVTRETGARAHNRGSGSVRPTCGRRTLWCGIRRPHSTLSRRLISVSGASAS